MVSKTNVFTKKNEWNFKQLVITDRRDKNLPPKLAL